MNDFVLSLRARDVEKLIALFPKDRPLKLASTITETATFSYEEAAAGMRARDRNDGLYSLLVDASDPTFMQYVLDGVEWTWVGGTRFVPDGSGKRLWAIKVYDNQWPQSSRPRCRRPISAR